MTNSIECQVSAKQPRRMPWTLRDRLTGKWRKLGETNGLQIAVQGKRKCSSTLSLSLSHYCRLSRHSIIWPHAANRRVDKTDTVQQPTEKKSSHRYINCIFKICDEYEWRCNTQPPIPTPAQQWHDQAALQSVCKGCIILYWHRNLLFTSSRPS